jgi:hypothetical protein
MSALIALKAARANGVSVSADGNDLVLNASTEPPRAVIALMSRHKADILLLLRPTTDGWIGEDWQAFFEERAAIAEFDGGLSRTQAEAQAFECCVVEWLSRNPARSTPLRCLNCGCGEHLNDPLLPFAAKITEAAWLHSLCWEDWSKRRRAEAIRSLSAVGIVESKGQTDRAHRGHR